MSDDLDAERARVERIAVEARRAFEAARSQPFACNRNYRLASEDFEALARFTGNAEVHRWYANGTQCEDRPNVLATFHPLLHKSDDGWAWIRVTAAELARDLGRWIWLTLGEDHWMRIMVDDPRADGEPRGGENDQYITTFAPVTGEEHFVGFS